jgi:hypothetical protein
MRLQGGGLFGGPAAAEELQFPGRLAREAILVNGQLDQRVGVRRGDRMTGERQAQAV